MKNDQEALSSKGCCPLAQSGVFPCLGHEIRTHLNAIIGSINLLASHVTDKEHQHIAQMCKTNSDAVYTFLERLDLLRDLEEEETQHKHSTFNIKSVIDKVIQNSAQDFDGHADDLEYSVDENLDIDAIGISENLRLLVKHILENAFRHAEDGKLRFFVILTKNTEENIDLRFVLEDTGKGLASDNLGFSFDKNLPAETEDFFEASGNSLDMTLAKRLIQSLNGDLEINYTPQIGTQVRINVRFSKPKTKNTISNITHIRSLDTTAKKIKILMAEDSDNNRLLVEMYLRGESVELDCVEDGRYVLDAIQSKEYDLVLMDMQMPHIDGYEATRKIRQWEMSNSNDSALPIVAITAHTLKSDQEKSFEAGCDRILRKPFYKEELIALLGSFKNAMQENEPSVVAPSKELESIIPKFLKSQEKVLEEILAAIKVKDFQAIARLGHAMKGYSRPYGFLFLEKMGIQIEQSALSKDSAELYDLTRKTSAFLKGLPANP